MITRIMRPVSSAATLGKFMQILAKPAEILPPNADNRQFAVVHRSDRIRYSRPMNR
ncbi:hypothetical protein HMPREF0758_3537 [Serratia odorifera DSM 4582]|uniref:Uncharacterized protein n=1 Tax=Serratia odorifera DSM 4582 TaxID=667129 RepID=D4E5T7_SEROD|nr:hypothetical protein HMPREF0758_3537 [Serratia odorifera DSM 4582]